MEDVLDVYARPLDPKRPVVCLDEGCKQLLQDSRPDLPMQAGQSARQDYEYVRQGMCSFFVTFAPLLSWRHIEVTQRRTAQDKLEIHYTPKHGSWLNMAEIELSVLARQCLDRRVADVDTLKREVAAWEQCRNAANSTVNWQFTTKDARVKLKKLYPNILP